MRTLQGPPQDSRLVRDLAMLRRMAAMLWGYITVGGRLRRDYRRREVRGEVFWVDEAGPTAHREAPLHRR